MQIVRSSGTSGANAPAKTTTKAASTSTTTQQDGRKLSGMALAVALISAVAILLTGSGGPNIISSGDVAFTFSAAFIAFVMGCTGNARGSKAGIGVSKAGGWSIALSLIVAAGEIALLIYLTHSGFTFS